MNDQQKKITISVPDTGEHMGVVVQAGSRMVEAYGPEEMDASDGHHTFKELYDHRITLYIALCKKLHLIFNKTQNVGMSTETLDLPYPVWRSAYHSDGTMYDGWFILGVYKEAGKQISYHIPVDRWDETEFAETLERAPEWDGHTPADVIERLKAI